MTRPLRTRAFAGDSVRALRRRAALSQQAMAARLGISLSYLSQIETNDRPLTPPVIAALVRAFPADWAGASDAEPARLLAAIVEAVADPAAADGAEADGLARGFAQQPALARRFLDVHAAWRRAEAQLQRMDDAYEAGAPAAGRLPWDEVRDWFHDAGNYVDPLDRGAEALADGIAPGELSARLAAEGIDVRLSAPGEAVPLRAFDAVRGLLVVDGALPAASRAFQLAHQLVRTALADAIAAVRDTAALRAPEAAALLEVGLANYAAGALLMPYAAFRDAALAVRHDIDRLRQNFGVSFEQACHRLSTLQRPGARGTRFFFCRVDLAGNITKRHSATRLEFARFGGACPLWVVHEAAAIPDRVLVQLAEMPDGTRYVSMAKGLVKESGSYARLPRRYAVALGCEVGDAGDFVYADQLDLAGARAATPIGVSCRICPRADCDQRAFPPSGRALLVDPDRRAAVPYGLA